MLKSTQTHLSIIFGVGLAICTIQRVILIAMIGVAIVVGVSVLTLVLYKPRRPPIILSVLIGVLVISALLSPTIWTARVYILEMVCVLLATATLGPQTLKVVGIGAVIGSISIIVTAVITDFARTGGMYNAVNYNIAIGTVLLGAVLWQPKYWWLIAPIILLGVFFTGAEEGIVGVAGLVVIAIIRRDFSKKILLSVGIVAITVAICTPLGITQRLWMPTTQKTEALVSPSPDINTATGGRAPVIVESVADIRVLGHGYKPQDVNWSTVHNVPLRVLYEVGPIGMLAWLGIILYGLIKTRWKYAFGLVLALSLFDHFMWTQLTPYFYTLVGVCIYQNSEGGYNGSSNYSPGCWFTWRRRSTVGNSSVRTYSHGTLS